MKDGYSYMGTGGGTTTATATAAAAAKPEDTAEWWFNDTGKLKRLLKHANGFWQKAYKDSLKLMDELTRLGFFDKLSAESKDYILKHCERPNGLAEFIILFGPGPKAGDMVTLEQFFELDKACDISSVDSLVKRWAEQGIIVECAIGPAATRNITYTLKTLPP